LIDSRAPEPGQTDSQVGSASGTTGSAVRAAEEGRRLVEVLVVFVGADGGIASTSCILGKF
jgi:hypothetical protein